MKRVKQAMSAILAGAMMLAATACGSAAATTEATAVGVAVEVQTLEPGNMENYVKVSTKVAAQSEVMVIPKVSGVVESVNVQVGDEVSAGDVLFVIDDKDIQVAITQAQAAVNSAQASVSSAQAGVNSAQAQYASSIGGASQTQLNQAKAAMEAAEINYNDSVKNLERTKELFEVGGVAQVDVEKLESSVELLRQQYENAKITYETLRDKTLQESANAAAAGVDSAQAGVGSAQAGVKSAQAQLQQAQNQLSYTKVKAEVGGIIGSLGVVVGNMAGQSSAAMTIVDIDKVKVVLGVPDDSINRVQVGSVAHVSVTAATDEVLNGLVTSVAPSPSSTGLYPVEVELDNPGHTLKPGMFASAQLVLNSKENVITLPLNAVISKNDETYVFVVEDGKAKKVNVETGIQNDAVIEITGGLTVGQQVVVKGQDYLADGSAVNVV